MMAFLATKPRSFIAEKPFAGKIPPRGGHSLFRAKPTGDERCGGAGAAGCAVPSAYSSGSDTSGLANKTARPVMMRPVQRFREPTLNSFIWRLLNENNTEQYKELVARYLASVRADCREAVATLIGYYSDDLRKGMGKGPEDYGDPSEKEAAAYDPKTYLRKKCEFAQPRQAVHAVLPAGCTT